MPIQTQRKLSILMLFGFALMNSACSPTNSTSASGAGAKRVPVSPSIVTPNPATPSKSVPVISSVVNDGVQANGKVQVELLGSFASDGANSVIAACGDQSPALSKRYDSKSRIVVSLDQTNGSCSFIVNHGADSSAASKALAFQAPNGQPNLSIKSARVASSSSTASNKVTGSSVNSRLDIVLEGNFYGASDSVWALCDSGQYEQIDDVYMQLDSSTELRLSIATPVSFNSCQFYVEHESYQSPRYSSVAVTEVTYVDPDPYYSGYNDFRLVGRWSVEPEVYVSCDNQEFQRIDETQIQNWDGSTTTFRMVSRESYSTCEAYAYADGVWSDIVYF